MRGVRSWFVGWLIHRRSALEEPLTRWRARSILWRLRLQRDSPFRSRPPEGFLRGIDFYSRQELIKSLTTMLKTYREAGGRYPNLVSPRLFSEKLSHAKFFSPIKVPESGNKLLTAHFLPAELQARVRVPVIAWQGDTARLPANGELAEGLYYLKASHGSSMVRRIRYPLTDDQRRALTATSHQWLNTPYGVTQGEWWYEVFPKKILIEEAVVERSPSLVVLLFVIDGDVAFISVDAKSLEPGLPTRCLHLDSNFRPLLRQKQASERLFDFQLSESLQRECLEVARLIGARFRSARIDLIVGDDGRIYLNEITLSSNSGLPFENQELDRQLGSLWRGADLFDLSQAIAPVPGRLAGRTLIARMRRVKSRATGWLVRRRAALEEPLTRWLAHSILWRMRLNPRSPFHTDPPQGWQRGIDFYSREELLDSITNVLLAYRRDSGRYPNLISPRLYTEKVNHAKFFSPIKIPESGNKLLTATFLPPSLRSSVSVPEIVWDADAPTLPDNESLPAGDYYLKASHGSSMLRRIRFPLAPVERQQLEATCREWLNQPYGLGLGEWWYNTFPKRILIERSVAALSPSIAFLFYVIRGEVEMICVYAKPIEAGQRSRNLRMDGRFRPMAIQNSDCEVLEEFHLSEANRRRCLEVAQKIGRQFRFVRIDLLIGDDERIYLNEVTLTPGAGVPLEDKDLDLHLGSLWPGTWFFEPALLPGPASAGGVSEHDPRD